MFDLIKKYIESELDASISSKFNQVMIQHNHPPLRFKVDKCPYCEKFGNVFNIN